MINRVNIKRWKISFQSRFSHTSDMFVLHLYCHHVKKVFFFFLLNNWRLNLILKIIFKCTHVNSQKLCILCLKVVNSCIKAS